ncbi:MFS transporter [Mycolicibacterium komossense]|uniref:MFS transporter n=1 Tax=Mycolicibacterium komossense TaxID=1779 RepID=A0ABT3CIZ7_9MYCO|nr:MFS transporter [Mycolicibacterium komossense]MCV7229332.1 MFS transporter [Mycolicibacterium komossense]
MAVGALFLTNGAMFANMLPRYPEIKTDLSMSNTGFGLAVAAFSAGALLSGLTAGVLIRRFGSASVAVASTVFIAAFVVAAAVAPTPIVFGGALFVAGAADAITDVAQNAHGLRVQYRYGRSILNSLHALWSIGAVLGGLMGAAAIALHISRTLQLTASGLLFSAICLASYRFLLHGPDHDEPHVPRPHSDGRTPALLTAYALVAALAIFSIAGSAVEDAGNSWATIYLRDSLGAPAAIAAFGYIAMVSFMFVGRLAGDRLVDRFGVRIVAAAGGVLITVGMGAALAFPTTAGTVCGFAAAGLGVATVAPAAFHAADNVPGLRPGTGLTVVTWLMRVGFLLAAPLVGAVADATSLRVGLLIVPVSGVLIVLFAMVLSGRRRALSARNRRVRWSAPQR